MLRNKSREYKKSCHKDTHEISSKEEKVETKATQSPEKRIDRVVHKNEM